jgi:hypothetical protein
VSSPGSAGNGAMAGNVCEIHITFAPACTGMLDL